MQFCLSKSFKSWRVNSKWIRISLSFGCSQNDWVFTICEYMRVIIKRSFSLFNRHFLLHLIVDPLICREHIHRWVSHKIIGDLFVFSHDFLSFKMSFRQFGLIFQFFEDFTLFQSNYLWAILGQCGYRSFIENWLWWMFKIHIIWVSFDLFNWLVKCWISMYPIVNERSRWEPSWKLRFGGHWIVTLFTFQLV